jgi:hypothetical protein
VLKAMRSHLQDSFKLHAQLLMDLGERAASARSDVGRHPVLATPACSRLSESGLQMAGITA